MLTTMINNLGCMTLRELFNYVVGIVAVISLIVERSKKLPFKPWSLLFRKLGEALNKGIIEQLETLNDQTKANSEAIIELDSKLEKKFKEKQKDDDEKEAKRLRESIIAFADSCRVGNHHTQNHFENVFRNYSDYIAYCDMHNIPNHFIDSEYRYIEETYQNCLKNNNFL